MKLLLLLFALFILDRKGGDVLEKYYFTQKSGEGSITTYALDECKDDVLIFGSSRANHHYVSKLIGDSLQLSCYNLGRNGMNILYADALLKEILKRYHPKMIILDVMENEFSFLSINNGLKKTTTALLPYLDEHPALASVISLSGDYEVAKAKLSNIYPYNSLLIPILQHHLTDVGMKNENGFQPLTKKMDVEKENQWLRSIPAPVIDTNSVNVMQEFLKIVSANNIVLYAIISPAYLQVPNQKEVAMMNDILQQYHFTLWNYSGDSTWSTHPELFRDAVHLNEEGAIVFSEDVVQRIKTNSGMNGLK
jgi:hypothetical protein